MLTRKKIRKKKIKGDRNIKKKRVKIYFTLTDYIYSCTEIFTRKIWNSDTDTRYLQRKKKTCCNRWKEQYLIT